MTVYQCKNLSPCSSNREISHYTVELKEKKKTNRGVKGMSVELKMVTALE